MQSYASQESCLIASPSQFTIRISSPPVPSQIRRSSSTLRVASEEQSAESWDSREQLLRLEIRQLTRENAFLKKKLSQLTAHSGDHRRRERTRSKRSAQRKGHPPKAEPLPLTLELFFEEVHNMLVTIVHLFRMEATPEALVPQVQELPSGRSSSSSRVGLARKLEKILLAPQEQAFPLLLQSFTDYYQQKEQRERKIIEAVDAMTQHTHALNGSLLQQAKFNASCRETDSTHPEEPPKSLRLPSRNIVANTRLATYSPRQRSTPLPESPFPSAPGSP